MSWSLLDAVGVFVWTMPMRADLVQKFEGDERNFAA